MFHFPLDALPSSPATDDPTLQSVQDPLALPAAGLEDLGLARRDEGYAPYQESPTLAARTLDCADLEHEGLWDTDDCCHDLCHAYDGVRPAPLRYGHVTVRGCCASQHAVGTGGPVHDDFIAKLFR
jgi:hypothetical protein